MGDRPCGRGARRARRPGLHQRSRRTAGPPPLRPDSRADGGARPDDLAAPDAHRRVARLRDRARVRLRDLVVARLAIRDGGRPLAACLLRSDRPAPAAPGDRTSRRRRRCRTSRRGSQWGRDTGRRRRASRCRRWTTSGASTRIRHCSELPTQCAASSSSSVRSTSCSAPTRRSDRPRPSTPPSRTSTLPGLSEAELAAVYAENAQRLLGVQ